MERFAFVTDCAENMPTIVGSSGSKNLMATSERLTGYACHQLKEGVKHMLHSLNETDMLAHLNHVKKMVTTVRHANYNMKLPRGSSVIKGCETRFGTNFNVLERFLRSANIL